jgi:hypothetical protein
MGTALIHVFEIHGNIWTLDLSGTLCEWELTDSATLTGLRSPGMVISPKRHVLLDFAWLSHSRPAISHLVVTPRIFWLLIDKERLFSVDLGNWGQHLGVPTALHLPAVDAFTLVLDHASHAVAVWVAFSNGDLCIIDPLTIGPHFAPPAPLVNLGGGAHQLLQATRSMVWVLQSDLLIQVHIGKPASPSCIFTSGLVTKAQSIPSDVRTPQTPDEPLLTSGIALALLGGCLFWITDWIPDFS